ncbi:MAG: hypothetical protein VYC17_04860 [Nitrospinota bacterium]|nr:hypothetical protein [Nitrospinota bacterium]
MSPQKAQHYYLMETDFGKKALGNWFVSDFLLPKPGYSPIKSVRTKFSPGDKTEVTEKGRLLQFLKNLYDKKLIDREEYEREKRELMKKLKIN